MNFVSTILSIGDNDLTTSGKSLLYSLPGQ